MSVCGGNPDPLVLTVKGGCSQEETTSLNLQFHMTSEHNKAPVRLTPIQACLYPCIFTASLPP